MSTTLKAFVAIVAVVLLIVIVKYTLGSTPKPVVTSQQNTQPVVPPTNTAPVQTVSSRDTSDASLTQDMATIDSHITTSSSDSAQADGSFNDTPVAQSE